MTGGGRGGGGKGKGKERGKGKKASPDDERARHIRETARKALADGTVKFVIGYQDGTFGGRDQPSFADKPEDCDRLKWGPGCTHNLAVYIMDDKRKPLKRGEEPDRRPMGMVVKGCDTMGLVELLKENIVKREDLFLIGVECDGIVDHERLEAALMEAGVPARAMLDIALRRDGDDLIVEYDGDTVRLPFKDVMLDKCRACDRHRPSMYDVLAGEEGADPVERLAAKEGGAEGKGEEDDFADVRELEDMTLEERWEYWKGQFSKCIRCYACRSACPLCYCEQCVVDPSNLSLRPTTLPNDKARRPKWVEKSNDPSETIFFHLVRALHNAGRCIDCGECERACPMDIPLRKLTRKLRKDMKEMFGYEPGTSCDDKPALATIRADDPEEYVR